MQAVSAGGGDREVNAKEQTNKERKQITHKHEEKRTKIGYSINSRHAGEERNTSIGRVDWLVSVQGDGTGRVLHLAAGSNERSHDEPPKEGDEDEDAAEDVDEAGLKDVKKETLEDAGARAVAANGAGDGACDAGVIVLAAASTNGGRVTVALAVAGID